MTKQESSLRAAKLRAAEISRESKLAYVYWNVDSSLYEVLITTLVPRSYILQHKFKNGNEIAI